MISIHFNLRSLVICGVVTSLNQKQDFLNFLSFVFPYYDVITQYLTLTYTVVTIVPIKR